MPRPGLSHHVLVLDRYERVVNPLELFAHDFDGSQADFLGRQDACRNEQENEDADEKRAQTWMCWPAVATCGFDREDELPGAGPDVHEPGLAHFLSLAEALAVVVVVLGVDNFDLEER